MDNEIKKVIEILNQGGIILYPTDTIWGIGCDATNKEAVQKIYAIKQREDSKSMLVLLDSESRLQQYIKEVPEIAWQLIEVSDKPLTIIYPGGRNLAENILAEDGSIGIRIAKDEFCQQLISRFKKPLVSTSANVSSQPSPQYFDQIEDIIRNNVDYIVNLRQNDHTPAIPSSIIKIGLRGEIQIIRM